MKTTHGYPEATKRAGFTLVELMVSTALIAVLMLLLLGTVDQTQQVWKRTTAKSSEVTQSSGGTLLLKPCGPSIITNGR